MATEGIKGFYSGVTANLIRSFGGSILLVGYDEVKTFFDGVLLWPPMYFYWNKLRKIWTHATTGNDCVLFLIIDN